MTDHHDGCLACSVCHRHLDETEQWPCLDCALVLCDVCECPADHLQETPC